MKRLLAIAFAVGITSAAAAQSIPSLATDNPRIQQVSWMPGQEISLTLLPETAMTVALERGEAIERVEVRDRSAIAARITAERNGFQLLPQREGDLGVVSVVSDRREYRFSVRTGTDWRAAYLVQVNNGRASASSPRSASAAYSFGAGGQVWRYRLRGDSVVRPLSIRDDGIRTQIEFASDAALPAIFAIGPSGEEQLVNGYMRDNIFVIDRVWNELVFRIDKEKATARRNIRADTTHG